MCNIVYIEPDGPCPSPDWSNLLDHLTTLIGGIDKGFVYYTAQDSVPALSTLNYSLDFDQILLHLGCSCSTSIGRNLQQSLECNIRSNFAVRALVRQKAKRSQIMDIKTLTD